jgi:hypothetical protein
MSRIRERRIFWDAPADTDVVGYEVYAEPTGAGDFLARVDAGDVTPLGVPADPEFFLGGAEAAALPEDDYQFAVTAVDDAGNVSDPYQAPAWTAVPLDLVAPGAPSNGGLEVL